MTRTQNFGTGPGSGSRPLVLMDDADDRVGVDALRVSDLSDRVGISEIVEHEMSGRSRIDVPNKRSLKEFDFNTRTGDANISFIFALTLFISLTTCGVYHSNRPPLIASAILRYASAPHASALSRSDRTTLARRVARSPAGSGIVPKVDAE
jgi:hypothetical protein